MKSIFKSFILGGLGLFMLSGCSSNTQSINEDYPYGNTIVDALLNDYSVSVNNGQYGLSKKLTNIVGSEANVEAVLTYTNDTDSAVIAVCDNNTTANACLEYSESSYEGYSSLVNDNIAMFYTDGVIDSIKTNNSISLDESLETLAQNLTNFAKIGTLKEYSSTNVKEASDNTYGINYVISVGTDANSGYVYIFNSSEEATSFVETYNYEGDDDIIVTLDSTKYTLQNLTADGIVVYGLTKVATKDILG